MNITSIAGSLYAIGGYSFVGGAYSIGGGGAGSGEQTSSIVLFCMFN